jgi:predicted RNA-binding protein with RPS1 domain
MEANNRGIRYAVAATAMLLPVAFSFSPQPALLRSASSSVCMRGSVASMMPALRPGRHGNAFSTVKMSENAEGATVAGVNEVSDQEQRSLSKTRTNKRGPKNDKNKKPLSDFKVGDTVKGKVVSIMTYGAFVDIGATTDGLVHVSQLANDFVQNVEAVVKVGDEVEVRVLSLDSENNKVSLTMRDENAARSAPKQGADGQARAPRTGKPAGGDNRSSTRKELPDEFKNFDDKVFLAGKVASVMDYGVFVSLNEDVDALVHVSEISEERNISPEKMFKVGQEVQVLNLIACIAACMHIRIHPSRRFTPARMILFWCGFEKEKPSHDACFCVIFFPGFFAFSLRHLSHFLILAFSQVRIVQYDRSKKRLSLSMKPWVEAAPKEEGDDIKNYKDPVPEDQKSAFQLAWEAAQNKQKAAA